jgi:hypothetical protein
MLTQLPATAKPVAVPSRRDRDDRSFRPNTKGFGCGPADIGPVIN